MNSPTAQGAPAPAPTPARLDSVDLLRGVVMIVMALDHVRDLFHFGGVHGLNALDLTRTTVPLFLTRWITHYCAPVFLFLAGTGAFLSGTRGKSKRGLSWFLLTRGLWLVLLELTYLNWAAWTFSFNVHDYRVQVIWAIGWSMVVLAALVHLPVRAVAIFGVAMIATHNALDGIKPESWGAWSGLWRVLHAGGRVEFASGFKLNVAYALIPWIGVMAAGYAFGTMLLHEPAARRRRIFILGLALTLAFVGLRFSNLYGNPKPWVPQKNAVWTILSFLDCRKYPPSLCYLLMTLGPSLMLLARFERGTPTWMKPILVFGRVPLFFYLLHIPLIHGLAVVAEKIRFGHADWLYGSNPAAPPANAGFGLPVVYFVWVSVVVLLYPACKWFAELKRRRRDAWLSYL